jgi:AraC family transcriptional regulator of arabinose operon
VLFGRGTPQLYGAAEGEFVNDWVHFEPNAGEESVLAQWQIPLDTVIPLHDTVELSDLVKCLCREHHSQNLHHAACAELYLDLLLLKLSEKRQARDWERRHPYYTLFCDLRNEIRQAPQRDWSIDAVSRRTCLSRSYAQHLYKAFFGISVTADVQRGRMEHARYLLSATHMTVTAVSRACGYDSDVHFMRVFKRETGRTPTAYRAEARNASLW